MGWSGFPVANDDDWSLDTGPLNQLAAALAERTGAVGSSYYQYEIGDDVQKYSVFAGMQGQVEWLIERYWNDTDNPDPDGQEEWGENYTWDRAKEILGMNADGWTRKHPRTIEADDDPGENGQKAWLAHTKILYIHNGTSWEVGDQAEKPDLVEEYGRALPGDYIGPWLFNELQAAIKLLKITVYQAVEVPFKVWAGTCYGASDWATAKAAAKAEYDASGDDWGVAGDVSRWTSATAYGTPTLYDVSINYYSAKYSYSGMFTGVPHTIKLFIKTSLLFAGDYSDFGTGMEEDKWKLAWQHAGSSDADELTDQLLGSETWEESHWTAEPAKDETLNKSYFVYGHPMFWITWEFEYA